MYKGLNRRAFALEMIRLSDMCIALCEKSNAVNDLSMWLLHENLLLLTMQHGDSSKLNTLFVAEKNVMLSTLTQL